jgi:hypothetical protein
MEMVVLSEGIDLDLPSVEEQTSSSSGASSASSLSPATTQTDILKLESHLRHER